MLNKDAWLKFSPLLDEAMDMEEQHRAEWLAQLEAKNPEAATFIRGTDWGHGQSGQ
jgi:hypothetical protein